MGITRYNPVVALNHLFTSGIAEMKHKLGPSLRVGSANIGEGRGSNDASRRVACQSGCQRPRNSSQTSLSDVGTC